MALSYEVAFSNLTFDEPLEIVASNDGATDIIMNRIARWNSNTNTFSALGEGTNVGVDEKVSGIYYSNNTLYIGGEFTNRLSKFAVWSDVNNKRIIV